MPIKLTLKLTLEEAERVRLAMKPALIGAHGAEFVSHFYNKLFEVAPQLRGHFPAEMTELRKKLLQVIGEIFHRLDDTSAIEKMLASIKPAHSPMNNPEAVASIFVQCFASAYKQTLHTDFPHSEWVLLEAMLVESVIELVS